MTATNLSAGAFTISGFLAGTTTATANADYNYDPGTFGGLDFSDPDTFGGVATVVAGPVNFLFASETASETTSGHAWTLTVRLISSNVVGSAGGEEILNGQSPQDGTVDGAGPGGLGGLGVTFTGVGAAALQAQINNISINLTQGSDAFGVEFTLTDVDTSSTDTMTQYFSGVSCFVAGTMIAVPAGEAPVESLKIGDLVMTADGVAKKVKWIGTRAYTAAVVAANRHAQPVIIRKDAVAPGMPHRDLQLSSNHAVFIDDSFVLAAALVNGVTVLRREELAPVAYYHIETEAHDVIFADGMPVETYVDDSSRLMFDNADEYFALYGADADAATFGANRLVEGVQLEAIRRRVAARADVSLVGAAAGAMIGNIERIEDGVLHGWAVDPASAGAVELDVLVDGEIVGRVIANGYRVDLDFHGIAGGIGGFTLAMPASVESLAQVSIRRPGEKVASIRGQVEAAVH